MHILDDIQNYNKLDPSNMLAHLHELPEKCESAWREAMNITLPGDYSNLNRVIILGMGGSAIGGELAQSLVTEKAFTAVHRDYGMPYPLDEKTLVIASSYSGETEETLDSFSVALDSPAKSIALTTGGRVKELAERHGKPVFTIKYKAPPRAALAYSLMPTQAGLHKVGLIA
ncbi:MAG: bifunctional phosphoglucose/phosphomannose isomerase, partial [Dehalococcoidia bacterium]|nr:bifunctional phosphoglucose/phosphomannose isomerase [Dehalococcoidia bacterium]